MTQIDLNSIGETISRIRKAQHLTQMDMAELTGYSERQYRRVENNGTNSLDTIVIIANALHVSPLSLLPLSGEDTFSSGNHDHFAC